MMITRLLSKEENLSLTQKYKNIKMRLVRNVTDIIKLEN